MRNKAIRSVRIYDTDNIGLALVDLKKGEIFKFGDLEVELMENIPYMHKFSLCRIVQNEPIIKRGEKIGIAVSNIEAGYHVHVHNMKGLEEYKKSFSSEAGPCAGPQDRLEA